MKSGRDLSPVLFHQRGLTSVKGSQASAAKQMLFSDQRPGQEARLQVRSLRANAKGTANYLVTKLTHYRC